MFNFWKRTCKKLGIIQLNSLYYLAGYVAFKCKIFSQCYYAIGSEQDIHKSKFASSQFSQWLSNINRGRLCYPSDHFWNQIQMLEDEFNQYYSLQLSRGIQSLISHIANLHPSIPIQLVKTFIRTRLFIKIRIFNRNSKTRSSLKKVSKFIT